MNLLMLFVSVAMACVDVSPTPIPAYPPPKSKDGEWPNVKCTEVPSAPPQQYLKTIDAAVQNYMDLHPNQFNGQYVRFPSDENQIINEIVLNMNKLGLEAVVDSDGEISVKGDKVAKGTGFSEQYKILTSFHQIPLHGGRYRAKCVPAFFSSWKY